jgi:hypothetical protein
MTQTQAVTPPRQCMLDDMKLRNMAASTRKVYVCSVAGFSALHGRSPDELTPEDMRDYQLHLVTRGLKASIPSGRTAFPRAQTPRKRLIPGDPPRELTDFPRVGRAATHRSGRHAFAPEFQPRP